MAYRRPGVTVTQEFRAAAPAIAALALPCCAVGPAYQLVDNDFVGTYSGAEQAYAYQSKLAGAIVDIAVLADDELYPITKKPISVKMTDVIVEIVPESLVGAGTGVTFSDVTTSIFSNVLAGDIVVIVPQLAVSIVPAQTNGISTDTTGQRDRLTAGTANQFVNVKVGDTVNVTGGTNTVFPLTTTVSIKLSSNVLVLADEINDGVGGSTDVAFSITGDRGVANEGEYVVKEVVDFNTLTLQSPLADTPEAPLSYTVKRELADDVVVARSGTGYSATEAAITIVAGFEVTIDANSFPVLEGNVYASYRAYRADLASEVKEYADIAAIEAVFGADQIHPSNPLAYALSIMKANTVSPVNGLGLYDSYISDETLAFTKSLDVLAMADMYALNPLSQLSTVNSAFKNHVEQLSDPAKKLERVAIINSRLNTVGLVQDTLTTSGSLIGARSIVSTQVDGSGAVASPAVLNDATADQFLFVLPGDTVSVVSGTGVTPGNYTVLSKQTSNQITLSANFITSGSPTNIQYYIVRKDGLGSDGQTFYDRNGAFFSNGAAPGHFLEILAGTYAGKYTIGSITSDKELVLASAIAGVVTLLTAVEYKIVRDLSKSEQAANIAGYSNAFGSRRVVHTWSDTLKAPVGNVVEDVPGYFGGSAVAALTTGLPTQQGFTNLTISGFTGLLHSTKYFTEDQLNTIADGGTFIFVQEGPDQPLLMRHQLTTDRSSIKFQEYSVTKNVDFIAKVTRDNYKDPIGKYNIIDTTLDYLKTVAQALITFFKDGTVRPNIGGVVRSGSLVSLAESTTQIDTVNIRFSYQIPIPLNYIDIVIEV